MRDSEVTGRGRRHTAAGRRGTLSALGGPSKLAIAAIGGAVCLLAAACSGSPPAAGKAVAAHGKAPGSTATAQITITPGNGTTNVKPNHGVSVTVAHGKLRTVTVVAGHDPLAGLMSKGGTTWHTLWALHPSTRYTVTATAVGTDGKTATATSSFRTLTPRATDTALTTLADQTYGVGMPIQICFSSPVTPPHRAQVEQSIQITSSSPVVGAWVWESPSGICSDAAQALDFRTQVYWPQHTSVSFVAHLNGLEASPGVYFTANLSQSFRIGNSLIGVTSTRTHRTRIFWKNKLYQVWDDSSGMPGDDTENGAFLTIDKGNPVLMSGPGYKNVPVAWSVRFTWSGDYYHSAPWSLGEQGFTNVSHGCVNLSPQHAQWYYQHEVPGDPITIIGSPVAGTWGDGWTDWFWTWQQLLSHSATHMAVKAGPAGSTFVNPATLPSVTPTVLTGSQPNNYLPGNHPA